LGLVLRGRRGGESQQQRDRDCRGTHGCFSLAHLTRCALRRYHWKSNAADVVLLSTPLESVVRTSRSQWLPVEGAPARTFSMRGFGMLARTLSPAKLPRTTPVSG